MRTVKPLVDGGLLHETTHGGATHYKPGLDDGGWMHVTEGDAFTDDPSAVTLPDVRDPDEGPHAMTDETDTTSEVARVRYVEAQPDSGPHRPAMPAHYRIEFADGTFWAIASSFLIRQGVPKPEEAQIATQEPAGEPGVDSAGRGASAGLDGGQTNHADHWEHQRPWHVIEAADPPAKDAP